MSKRPVRRCVGCRETIPAERLAVFPATRTCARCSRERKKTVRDVDLDGADRDEVVKSAQDGGVDND